MASVGAQPIVALDVGSRREALGLVERLGTSCDFYKVGSELFTSCGPDVVHALSALGKRIFLDLKFHDIPNTVEKASRAAAACGASLLTVHASGGRDMLRAAVEGSGGVCGVLAVTVLTSLDAQTLAEAWGVAKADPNREVRRLARLAAEAGAHGVVCSGEEVSTVAEEYGDQLATLVPGIRFAGGETHDQSRVVTPSEAQRLGARYLVIGRAVTGAASPKEAMERVWRELHGEES